MRPGKAECADQWPLVQEIYAELVGGERLPDAMPVRERRTVDYVLVVDGTRRILEVDEKQHFNRFRARTLAHYADEVPVAFRVEDWIGQCAAKAKLEGGGFGRPRPPLFPGDGGRHRQRAFRDMLADVLPAVHGWLPTLRIGDFEAKAWIEALDARERMRRLLDDRL
jgi:hypothetical protein